MQSVAIYVAAVIIIGLLTYPSHTGMLYQHQQPVVEHPGRGVDAPPWMEDFDGVIKVYISGWPCSRQDLAGCAVTARRGKGFIYLKPEYWDARYPTETFLHEYAHLECYGCGHDDRFYQTLDRLLVENGYNHAENKR